MGSLVPPAALRRDGVTLHPWYYQRAMRRPPLEGVRMFSPASGGRIVYPPGFPTTAALVDRWRELAQPFAFHYGMPLSLILAIIHQESGGNPDAYRNEPRIRDISVGLMQLLVGTARGLGYRGTLAALFVPETNLSFGVTYYTQLYKRLGNPELALIAYNAGPGAATVRKVTGWAVPGLRYARTVLALQQMYVAWTTEHPAPTGRG